MISMLTEMAEKYPRMQGADCVKALYQASFGCEHLITDAQSSRMRLEEEWQATPEDEALALTESLGRDYVRVNIASAKARGMRPQTLNRLLLLTAGEPKLDEVKTARKEEFLRALNTLEVLSERGSFAFDASELRAYLDEYRRKGCPSVHHSGIYRAAYRPAYRVIGERWAKLLPMLVCIDRALAQKERILIAIDGGCAGGKTTLAAELAKVYDAPIIHMDDFFLTPELRTPERLAEPGRNVHYERFREEVATPYAKGGPFSYRPYRCHAQAMGEAIEVPEAAVTIVEGSYSLHPALSDGCDVRILLEVDPETQMRRILRRNGEKMAKRFRDEWIPMENRYFEATRIESRIDCRMQASELKNIEED